MAKPLVSVLTALLVTTGVARADKPISDEQIKSTVDAHVADLKTCMGRHGAATGQLRVEFTIQPDGKVSDSKVGQASSNPKLDQCIAQQFGKWTFPHLKSGGPWLSSYPITFSAPAAPKQGTLTEAEINATIKPKLPEVQACLTEAKKEKADVAGLLDLGIVVSPEGKVTDVKVLKSTTQAPKLDQCVIKHLGTWQFAKPKGGGEFAFHYPFKLNVP